MCYWWGDIMALGWKDKNDNIFWKSARTSDIHSLLLPILQHQGRHSDIQPPEMVLCWAQFNLGLVKIIRILEREHTLHNLDWANNKSGPRLFCDVLAYSLHQIFIISTSTDRFGFILLHNVYRSTLQSLYLMEAAGKYWPIRSLLLSASFDPHHW